MNLGTDLRTAFGGDPLATRAANCAFLASGADTIGEFHVWLTRQSASGYRFKTVRNVGRKMLARIRETFVAAGLSIPFAVQSGSAKPTHCSRCGRPYVEDTT